MGLETWKLWRLGGRYQAAFLQLILQTSCSQDLKCRWNYCKINTFKKKIKKKNPEAESWSEGGSRRREWFLWAKKWWNGNRAQNYSLIYHTFHLFMFLMHRRKAYLISISFVNSRIWEKEILKSSGSLQRRIPLLWVFPDSLGTGRYWTDTPV